MSALRDALRAQARACANLGSPFTARLMSLAADRLLPGGSVADRLLGWADPSNMADSVPLRLAGALHRLVLNGASPDLARHWPPHDPGEDDALWRAVETALADHADILQVWLDSPPQTNEVRRAAALIPAFHMLADATGLPLDLAELGASAGLNLMADRFGLDAGGVAYGPQDATVCLSPRWTGPAPQPCNPVVAARSGVDLRPIDAAAPDDRTRLLSYIWPDQPDRIARTDAAIAIAAQSRTRIDAGDAASWLKGWLRRPPDGACRTVFHTVARQYFPTATRDGVDRALRRAGAAATADGPLALIALEADGDQRGAGLTLTLWPGGAPVPLARVDYHGRWVDWHGPVGVA